MSAAAPLDAAALPDGILQTIGATPQRLADVEAFAAMLGEANARMNLVGASTMDQFWSRHFLDSAQLLWFEPRAVAWADLGAGAGLPGIVLAILLKDRPGAKVHLVESVAKRCAFLARVVAVLGLPAQIHNERAEILALDVEVVTARACAPLSRLLGFAAPTMAGGARGLFLKGQEVDSEVAQARKVWEFAAAAHPSLSDSRGRVLAVTELARVRRA